MARGNNSMLQRLTGFSLEIANAIIAREEKADFSLEEQEQIGKCGTKEAESALAIEYLRDLVLDVTIAQ